MQGDGSQPNTEQKVANALKWAAKEGAKAGLKKLGIIFGVKAVVIGLLVILLVVALSAIFEGSAMSGNFTGDPTLEDSSVNQQLKDRYIKAATDSTKDVRDYYKQEDSFQLSWGILAALDKMTNNCEEPIPEKNAEILGPKFYYKSSKIITTVKTETTDKTGKKSTTYSTTETPITLLTQVVAYDGIYYLKYGWATEKPDSNTTVNKEELLGTEHTPDFSNLKNRMDVLGLSPEGDFDFLVALSRVFVGDDPELALETELEDIDDSIGLGPDDILNIEPGEPSIYGFIWPTPGYTRISSPYGPRQRPVPGASAFHKAIDIACPVGSTVLATKSGTVVFAAPAGEAGNLLIIDHGGSIKSKYLHLSRFLVSVGDRVTGGSPVALSGNTGIGTGAHLDFRIMFGNTYVNPIKYVFP